MLEPTPFTVGQLTGYAHAYLDLYNRWVSENDNLGQKALLDAMKTIELDGFRRLAFNLTQQFLLTTNFDADDEKNHDAVNWVGFAVLIIALAEGNGVELRRR